MRGTPGLQCAMQGTVRSASAVRREGLQSRFALATIASCSISLRLLPMITPKVHLVIHSSCCMDPKQRRACLVLTQTFEQSIDRLMNASMSSQDDFSKRSCSTRMR